MMMYAIEILSTTKEQEQSLRVMERKILQMTLVLKKSK